MLQVYCDKCQSTDIKFRLKEPPKIERLPLSEYAKWKKQKDREISIRPGVVMSAPHVATCMHCGYSVDYEVTSAI